MTCPHCLRLSAQNDLLRDQVRDLQTELGLRAENGALGAMMGALGLSPTEALIAGVLRAAKGRQVSIESLIWSTNVPSGENIRAHVYRIRKKLGADAVLSQWGRGYALSDSGLRMAESARLVDCT